MRLPVRLVVVLLLPLAIPAVAQQPTVHQRGSSPKLETINEVVQGEVMYVEFEKADTGPAQAVRLLDPARVGKTTVFPAGEVLYRNKKGRYCKETVSQFLGPRQVCLSVGAGGKFVSRQALNAGAVLGTSRKLSKHAAFEQVDLPALGEQTLGLFRNEIVYQGAAGGILRLLYQEFTGGSPRPAVSQELTYDIGDEPLTVSVKGARLEVLEAGNAGIKYKVLKGFSSGT